MAGIGHLHRPVVLVASPGAALPTARRGASSWIGAWAPWQLAHVVMSWFSWGVQSGDPRNGDRKQGVRASRSWCAYSRPSLRLWMLWIARQHAQLATTHTRKCG